MTTIKVKNSSMLFEELNAGDIFSFMSSPDIVYIRTSKSYHVGGECENCGESTAIELSNFCINLKTGSFHEVMNPAVEVILYKRAELTLSI